MVKGINILTRMVSYDDFSIPVGYEIIEKDVAYYDIKTKKMHRKSSTTKNQLFRSLIEQAVKHKVLF
jgi:hypothetical protein